MSILSGASFVSYGDSITQDQGDQNNYSFKIATDLGITAHIVGIGGIGWNHDGAGVAGAPGSLINRAAAQIDTPYVGNNPQPFLILFAGTNDMSGPDRYTGAQTYASFQTCLADRIAAGWKRNKIIVVTMLSRNPDQNIIEAERVIYNGLLVSGSLTDLYTVARTDLDSRIGFSNSYANATYFLDGTHPTGMGYQVIADIIKAVRDRRLIKIGS